MLANIKHISKGIKPAIVTKAIALLERCSDPEHRRKHIRLTHRNKYKVITVDYSHRLLNTGRDWSLLTHEQYNVAVKKK